MQVLLEQGSFCSGFFFSFFDLENVLLKRGATSYEGTGGSPVCRRFDFLSPLSSYSVLTFSLFPPYDNLI